MLSALITKLGIGLASIGLAVGALFGIGDANLGATYQTPDAVALFETTLASGITSSATSFTLTSATDFDGNTLASSTYGFIIDEGTASEEMVLADCTSTTCTNVTRGLSARTGTSTVSTLQKTHRRGASVKMTDAPALIFATNVFKGRQVIENPLRYNNIPTDTLGLDSNNLASVGYANDLAFGAIPEASESAAGFVELATGLEAASSTSSGSAARLALPASLATSTYNSATAPLKVVVTGNNGKIDGNFLNLGTLGTTTFNGSLTLTGNSSVSNIASSTVDVYVATTTAHAGNYTWTKPVNLKYIRVVAVGGGGGSGGTTASPDHTTASGGGGAYSEEILVPAQLGATEAIIVGNGGAGGLGTGENPGSNGGASSFGSYLSAGGGNASGNGGTATGGTINIPGQSPGSNYVTDPGGEGRLVINPGGSSLLGFGGAGSSGTGDATASAGQLYGGGASGTGNGSTANDNAGAAGASGVVIIFSYFF